jgi:hypothetical protein
MNTLGLYPQQTRHHNRLAQSLFVNGGIGSIEIMKKITLVFLLLSLATGCSSLTGTQQTAEMEFCWERGMNFTWIDEYDAGCIQPIANSVPMRISKIRWLEENLIGLGSLTRLTTNVRTM